MFVNCYTVEYFFQQLNDNQYSSPDIGISNTTITNTAWRLLEYFTLKHEESDNNSELHKAVAQKLLQDGAFLPQWLLISYKVSRPQIYI